MVLRLNLIIFMNSKLDIIAITVNSHKNNENFKSNVDIEGGTALYVNEKLNIIERKDLKPQNDDYKSVY